MDDRFLRLQDVVNLALDAPPQERASIVAAACADDPELRAEVEALLDCTDAAADFLEVPAETGGAERSNAPGSEALVGRQVGPYRLREVIASGGMGTVYRAERADDEYRKQVAIKFIRSGPADARTARRFRRERQLLADLEHPYIARLLDGGTIDDGWPYLVMELVEGERIDRFCDERRLPVPARVELFRKVCESVAFAHRNLIVHCDLKPANVLVRDDGEPKLLDFGIARMLATSSDDGAALAGTQTPAGMTPPYSSPELVVGRPVTTSSDVYSLGVILCELLCGHRPVDLTGNGRAGTGAVPDETDPLPSDAALTPRRASRDDPSEAMAPEAIAEPRSTTPRELRRRLHGDLDSIVTKAVSADPTRRYESVEQLSEDLRRHLEHLPVRARAGTVAYRTGKFIRRRALAVSVVALLAVCLIAGTVLSSVGFVREAQARRRADAEAAKALQISEFLGDTLTWADPLVGLRRDKSLQHLLDHAAGRISEQFARDPEVEAVLRLNIGVAYQNLGDLASAEPHLRATLRLRRRVHGEAHPDVAEAMHALATLLHIKGDDEEAESLYRQALRVRRELFGEEHADVAQSMHDLATHLRGRGPGPEEAERLLLRAIEVRRRTLGPDHAKLADSLEGLGNMRTSQGSYEQADRLLRDALSIRRRALPDGDPAIARTYHNLAHLSAEQGDLDRAEQHYRESIEMSRRVHGELDSSLLNPLMMLARLAEARGDTDQAEELLREAVEVGEQSLPPGHFMTLLCRNRYGHLLVESGRYAEAEPHLLAVHEGLLELLGAEHPQARGAGERVVALYEAWGRADLADEYRSRLAAE